MGKHSGNRMGAPQSNSHRKVFVGSAERFNTMTKVGEIIKELPTKEKERLRAGVSTLFRENYPPEAIIRAVTEIVADFNKVRG